MTNLELDADDVTVLTEVIRSYLSDLHDEIVHTESFEFREALQARQQRVTAILARLGGGS